VSQDNRMWKLRLIIRLGRIREYSSVGMYDYDKYFSEQRHNL
jgi:uncharacterized short protein YbdD (DUF466 family)